MSPTRRFTVIIFLAIAGALILFWRWHVHHQKALAEVHAPTQSAPQDVTTETTHATTANTTPTTSPLPPPTQKPSLELRKTFETLNHNEIVFYGRAVDQFGEPVPAADVEGIVLVNTGSRGGQVRRQTATDAQGYFQFGGLKGQDLGIGIRKEGYEYRRRESSFSYSYFEADHKRHIPDPKNPVVFVLWKKQGAEPLIHYEKVWRFPVNSGPVKIDLLKAKVGQPDADITVNVSRTPLTMPYGDRGFAWKVAMDVEGGGLVSAGEIDYYNQAPATGYEPHLEYVQEAQSIRAAQEGRITWTWRENVADTFYLTSRNGKNYARIELRIRPNSDRKEGDNEALIAAKVWLNPNGSRNLEFDPAKATKPSPTRHGDKAVD
jgi:hypothetical protein